MFSFTVYKIEYIFSAKKSKNVHSLFGSLKDFVTMAIALHSLFLVYIRIYARKLLLP